MSMSKMIRKGTVVSLFDYTGLAVAPWVARGWRAICLDIQHEGTVLDRDRNIYLSHWDADYDVLDHPLINNGRLSGERCVVLGFPPCDDMSVAGARWFAKKLERDPLCQKRAAFRAFLVRLMAVKLGTDVWMAENPVSVLSSLWRKPNYTFHPYEYGGYLPEDDQHPTWPDIIPPRDAYPKRTCLWTGPGFVMPEKKPVADVSAQFHGYTKLGGKSARTKEIRSATPRGFALAVAEANG